MAKFIVKGRVKYNGKAYESGAVVEVDKKDVEEFKKHGWKLAGKEEAQEPSQEKDAEVKLTQNSKKDLIIAELVKRGIEHDPEANKADLFALLA